MSWATVEPLEEEVRQRPTAVIARITGHRRQRSSAKYSTIKILNICCWEAPSVRRNALLNP
jgi:hypothetical protein